MPSTFPTITLPKPKGLNLRDDIRLLKSTDLYTATNVYINEVGDIERMDGFTLLFTSLGASYFNSFVEHVMGDGTRNCYGEYSGTLYHINPNTWVATSILTGLTAGARIGYAPWSDYLFFGNGFDANKVIIPVYRHKINRTAVATANATDLASVKTLANALKADMNTHLASTTQHNVADTTNTIGFTDLAGGDTQGTTNTACNELKTDFNAHRSQASVHPTTDSYHLVEAADASSEATSVTLINQIKKCYNQHTGDGKVQQWSITAPTTAPTLALAAGTELEEGTYLECYTFYNTVDGVESAPSPTGTIAVTAGNERISLSAMDISTDPQVTHKRIYRTVVGGATFYYVGQITNVALTYSDTTADASLGAALTTEDFTTIPATSMFVIYNGYVFMSGNVNAPYRLYFTEFTAPSYYNAATNFYDDTVAITALAVVPSGVLSFEDDKTWYRAGNTALNLSLFPVSLTEGCTNPNGVGYYQNLPIWVSRKGIRRWNGSMVETIPDEIDKILITKNLNSAAVIVDDYNQRIHIVVASS